MANRPHRLRSEIFSILFVLARHIKWSLLLHDIMGNWMIPLQPTSQWCCSKIANAFELPEQPPKLPLPLGGSAPPSNTWILGTTQVFIQNGISIGSAVFAQLTVECPITLQWAATFSPKIAPYRLGIGSPYKTWFLGPTWFIIPNCHCQCIQLLLATPASALTGHRINSYNCSRFRVITRWLL